MVLGVRFQQAVGETLRLYMDSVLCRNLTKVGRGSQWRDRNPA